MPEALAEVDAWINRVRGFWNERLDSLERELAGRDSSPAKYANMCAETRTDSRFNPLEAEYEQRIPSETD